jgi:RimJ/RimL family protein N-acetyltransferase
LTPSRVRLRPPTLDDLGVLELWRGSRRYTGEFNDFGDSDRPTLDEPVRDDGTVIEHGGVLLVELVADRRPIGTVSWRAVWYGPNTESRAWNVGINLVPEGRYQGFGVEAQRLLVDRLLATTRVNRIEASTDIDNLPEQRALEKAGFLREGVLRGAQYRAGTWHDLVSYAIVRKAPSARPRQS